MKANPQDHPESADLDDVALPTPTEIRVSPHLPDLALPQNFAESPTGGETHRLPNGMTNPIHPDRASFAEARPEHLDDSNHHTNG